MEAVVRVIEPIFSRNLEILVSDEAVIRVKFDIFKTREGQRAVIRAEMDCQVAQFELLDRNDGAAIPRWTHGSSELIVHGLHIKKGDWQRVRDKIDEFIVDPLTAFRNGPVRQPIKLAAAPENTVLFHEGDYRSVRP